MNVTSGSQVEMEMTTLGGLDPMDDECYYIVSV